MIWRSLHFFLSFFKARSASVGQSGCYCRKHRGRHSLSLSSLSLAYYWTLQFTADERHLRRQVAPLELKKLSFTRCGLWHPPVPGVFPHLHLPMHLWAGRADRTRSPSERIPDGILVGKALASPPYPQMERKVEGTVLIWKG